MEQWLIELIVIGAFVLVAVALLQYFGVVISPIVWRIVGIIVGAIILVVVIRLLWPILIGGGALPSLK